MRVEIHVVPRASTASVGGELGGTLVVHVVEPPAGGRATGAALRALADALAVPSRSVTLVRGATSRRKLVDVDDDEAGADALARRVGALRAGVPVSAPRASRPGRRAGGEPGARDARSGRTRST